MLGEPAIGGDLAAEHRQERRRACRGIELQNVVAGRLLRLGGAVIVERPDAGIGPADPVRARPGLRKYSLTGAEKIVGLALADGGRRPGSP